MTVTRIRATAAFFHPWVLALAILLSGNVLAELKALEDDFLSGVSGQSGITLDLEANTTIEEVAYFEDGKGIALQGLRLASAADPLDYADFRLTADILDDGALVFVFTSNNVARFEIAEIRFVDNPGVTPLADAPSLGGIFFDFVVDGGVRIKNRGNGAIDARGTLGGVYDILLSITDGRLGYRTNGNEFFLDGLSLEVSSMGTVLGATPAGVLNFDMPDFLAELSVDAIRFSDNPLNHGVTNDLSSGLTLPSYGSLWAKMDLDTAWQITAGGRYGVEGLSMDSQTTINRLDLAWGDDTDWADAGYWLGGLDISGQVDITNLTVDVLADPDSISTPSKDYGVGLSLAFDQLEASLHIQDFVLGETKTNIDAYVLNSATPVKSIGSLDINLTLADGLYDGTAYSNVIYMQAGGNADAGYQGLRLDTQLSVISPNNESNFIYTDDGNALMLSGFEAFADGDLTLDITKQETLGSTEFYDGLRVGFEDFAFGYQIEGLRAAKNTGDIDDLKAQETQAAQSVPGLSGGLFGLSGAPSLKGVLNGHITLGPGGNVGSEGITINSDLALTEGSMATYLEGDGSGRGLWLSGLNYDVHLRDMMLDVTEDGLRIYESESWSRMDVTDFKVGDVASGSSFGRLIFETYEAGSISTISAGGAGQVCIGSVGVDEASCGTGGGRWEDRGSQGVTISTQRHFQDSIELEGKRNRFTWETGRSGEGTASPVNGSGMQLVFDNFTTNDGDGLTDSYGLRTDYNIDVAQTYVVKKSTGSDKNSIVGNKGDVKVMNADGSYRYVAPGDLTPADLSSLPVGVALRTRTHFKELDFESVKLVHPTGGESTLLYGLKMQNFDITTDITATPLD